MRPLYLSLLLALAGVACHNAASAPNNQGYKADDAAKEQAAILKVIEKETDAFFARDYEKWKSTRAAKPYDFQGWNNADGTFEVTNGWQQVDNSIKTYISRNDIPIQTAPEVIRKNIQCTFYGADCAYLTWDEYVREDTSQTFYHSKDLRLTEKVNGDWKIVSVAAFWNYKQKVLRDSIH